MENMEVNLESMKAEYYVNNNGTAYNVTVVYDIYGDGFHTVYVHDAWDVVVTVYYEDDQWYSNDPNDEAREVVEYFKKTLNIK